MSPWDSIQGRGEPRSGSRRARLLLLEFTINKIEILARRVSEIGGNLRQTAQVDFLPMLFMLMMLMLR